MPRRRQRCLGAIGSASDSRKSFRNFPKVRCSSHLGAMVNFFLFSFFFETVGPSVHPFPKTIFFFFLVNFFKILHLFHSFFFFFFFLFSCALFCAPRRFLSANYFSVNLNAYILFVIKYLFFDKIFIF